MGLQGHPEGPGPTRGGEEGVAALGTAAGGSVALTEWAGASPVI